MNSIQLENILSNTRGFLGVFASNQLPEIIPSTCSLITNTDPDYKSGLHWQCIIIQNNIVYFFCSFGGPPIVPAIKSFCNRFPLVFYNREKHQRINESSCGAFCIFIINEMAKGKSFESILRVLKGIKRDDAFVRDYLIRNFDFHF